MSTFNNNVISWLLEEDNPAIAYRTRTELLGLPSSKTVVLEWIYNFIPKDWYKTKGLWYRYYITALAECGLTLEDIKREYLEKAFSELENTFDCNCADFLLLRSLAKLGYPNEPVICKIINELKDIILPDNGFLCLHRLKKLKYTPKSCYKANLHALLFFAEIHKIGLKSNVEKFLADYFFNHNLFYKSTDRNTLVLNCREGKRTIDTFYPFEVTRIGIQNVIEAFCALGYGNDERLKEAWDLMDNNKNDDGKMILKGTLAKSYLPKERVGKPSKWVTFYSLLAEKERQ